MESVLNQTWKNLELIVVDDASDDDTPQILSELKQEVPIKVLHNTKPKGAAASRNISIEQANGEFVAGLDDDDFWHPERIEHLMELFRDEYSAVCSNDLLDFGNRKLVWKKRPVITLNNLLYYNCVGNQVLTKKEYIINAGWYDESLPSAQDYDLWIRLAEKFGPIKTAPFTLQTVSMENERNSITTSPKKVAGYRACLEKHRTKMSEKQIIYQQYRLKLAGGENTTWFDMFRAAPPHLIVKEITRRIMP